MNSHNNDALDAVERTLNLLSCGVATGAIWSALERSSDVTEFRMMLGLLEDLVLTKDIVTEVRDE